MKTLRARPANTLRIIAGQWRSRRLAFPDVEGLRPTADRVRETLFNWLQDSIAREDCLDLFAGSGACGMEALSRGARHVTFVDNSAAATAAIRKNLALLGAAGTQVVCEDSLRWVQQQSPQPRFGLVFLDPPFAADLLTRSAVALEASGLLREGALVYVESAQPLTTLNLPLCWRPLKGRQAGSVHFGLFQRQAEAQTETSP
jgi:16S rRNA (guanine966-N2)-methyltransferase